MKKYFIPLLGLLFVASLSMTSCTTESAKYKKATDLDGIEYTSAYVCPMHCEGSGSTKPGNCPACKMDYVINEKVQKQKDDGHDHDDHDHSHDGHNH